MSDVVIKFVPNNTVLKFPTSIPGRGVPAGGDVSDVLTKVGVGDYDTAWLPPGAADNLETYPAGENLSTGRGVVIEGGEAIYFQPTNTAHHGRVVGITRSSATTGNDVTIQPFGVVSDGAFSFSPDIPLWIGADGEVVDSQSGGWSLVQKAGISMENDKMLIDFSVSILKS